MSEKMKWLEKYAPLGIGVEKQVIGFMVGLVIATLHSMLFLVRYSEARQALYESVGTKQKLIEGAIILNFDILIS